MKFLILLQLLVFFTRDITCDDSILSKFHQNTYKIRDLRTTLNSYNKEYFNFIDLRTFKYNRTTTALNGTLNMKVNDVYDKIEVLVQAYKFLSNEYRRMGVRFQINLKKAADSNVLGVERMSKCGNFTTASFEKDATFHFCNYVIDETHLPPLVPSGRYKIDLIYLYLNKEIAYLSGFAEVYTPIAYPKK